MSIIRAKIAADLARRPEPGPCLTLAERDRRWAGLRALMAARNVDAIVVGSFGGRERLESYLIDDFLDALVVLPLDHAPVVLSFSTSRVSRIYESERRGFAPWVEDIRIGFGGIKVADVVRDLKLARGTIGLVGLGPTAPGETEGLLPHKFCRALETALPDATLDDFTGDFTDFMLVKSTEELALLRFAAFVSEQASARMAASARPGMNEAELYADILHEVHRWGCETRYPFLSLQSGPDNIAWGAPRWSLRAEAPRILARGDMVQAEIHTLYGGQECQVQMSVALDPVDDDLRRCEAAATDSFEAGLAAVRPGATFADVVHAMEPPLRDGGFWSKTPLLHTLTFGATGFTDGNRAQLDGTREGRLEAHVTAAIRRGDLVLRPGTSLEIEPNACWGTKRVNIGCAIVVTDTGCEVLNDMPTRVHHSRA